MTEHQQGSCPTLDRIRGDLAAVSAEAALALGLIRVLTLLPFYDLSLEEVERHLAAVWNSLIEIRELLDCDETAACNGEGADRP